MSAVAASRSWWGITVVVPALLTRMSSRPWRSMVVSISREAWSAWLTSAWM